MGWRSDAAGAIRRYPQHLADEQELRKVAVTASLNPSRASHELSRTTENAALKELPPDEQRELDAVRRAIDVTLRRHANGRDRVRLIEMLYWRTYSRRSVETASEILHVSASTAKLWRRDFVYLVDTCMRVKEE